MQTSTYGVLSAKRMATRIRTGDAHSPIKELPLSAALNALAALAGVERETEAIAFLVDVIDSALERGDIAWCGAFLDAIEVGALTDDVALSPLIGTFLARAALPGVRLRYAARVRAVLADRGWSPMELARAIDDLI